jgi:GNAT superfamily N-acetyltransferase
MRSESMALVRLATLEDVAELVQMRWDFSEEEHANQRVTFEGFSQVCSEFLVKAIESGDWYIWVAEINGNLVSHMYLQFIHKVPRPGKSPDPYYGYVTNVYTRPAFRSQGIGTKIHTAMEQWSKENEVEFLILWPSSDSVQFYSRNGFSRCEEAMEKHW